MNQKRHLLSRFGPNPQRPRRAPPEHPPICHHHSVTVHFWVADDGMCLLEAAATLAG